MESYCTEMQEEKTFCQIFRIVIVNSSSVARMMDKNRAKGFIGEEQKKRKPITKRD